jgi:hypothetical protein
VNPLFTVQGETVDASQVVCSDYRWTLELGANLILTYADGSVFPFHADTTESEDNELYRANQYIGQFPPPPKLD